MILDEKAQQYKEQVSAIRKDIRDFFVTLDWEDDSTNISRSEINTLLTKIGVAALYAEYSATVTIIVGLKNYSAESIEDVTDSITNDIEVHIGSYGNVSIDQVEVDDIEVSW